MHRVLDKRVCLPQAAERLDASLPIYSNEILLDVEKLNIDAASFVQIEKSVGKDPRRIGEQILSTVRERGKQHNTVTGSGGMLIGTVRQVGSKYRGPLKVKAGDRIATLVSLTLTPLKLEAIDSVLLASHQVSARGTAVLFETGIAARLPSDLPDSVSMAVFDVAGAPALVAATCKAQDTLVVIGAGGKAGCLSCVAARKKMGRRGKIIAIEPFAAAAHDLEALDVCDAVIQVDATDPIAVQDSIERATHGKMASVVVNVASVPNTELSAILSARRSGTVIFFSMATSFSRVTLGAEGIASEARLIFGNGYFPNHDKVAIELVRKNAKLRNLFCRRYQT